jgi:hypothetical protein
MKIRPLTTAVAALGASSVLCLAGCHSASSNASGGTPVTQGSGNPGSSAPAGGTPATGAPAPAGKKIDVCTALPLAMASQITGTKFTASKPSNVENVVFDCEYSGPGSALLQISVDTEEGAGEFSTDINALKTVGHPPVKISGVGDEAFSEPNPNGNAGSVGASSFASYGAVFGQDYIKIGGLTYVNADQGKQIVEQIHNSL